MREILILLRIRFLSLFASLARSSKNKKTKAVGIVAVALLFLFVFLVFGILFFSVFAVMAMAMVDTGADFSFYFALAAVMALLLSLFGSVFATQGELYGAKDNELLLSMPLRPSSVFISRLLLLFLIDLLMGGIVILPAALAYMLFVDLAFLPILAFLLLSLLLSVAALAVSCLLGWLVTLVTARIKHKNILSLVTMVLFFVAYMAVMMTLSESMEHIEENIGAIISSVSPYLTAFSWMGSAIVHGDLLAGLAFCGVCLALILPAAFFLIRTYPAILTMGRATARYEYRERAVKSTKPLYAIMRNDIRRFLGNATYMMNAGIGLIFYLIVPVLLLSSRGELIPLLEGELGEIFGTVLPASVIMMLLFFSSTVIISAPSVSLEAKTVWLLKSLPLGGGDILCAKAYAHALLVAPFAAVGGLLCAIALECSVPNALALILLPVAANIFCAFLGVVFGLLFPKFDYITEAAAIKSGAAVLFTMLIMMAVSIATGLPLILLALIGLPMFIPAAVFTLLLLLGAFLLRLYLRRGGARRFARL